MTAVTTPNVGTKSSVKIFANVFISFIGAGILGLPYAFKTGGIIESAFVITIVGIISIKAMLLIIDCKYMLLEKTSDEDSVPLMASASKSISRNSHVTYGDIGEKALGNLGRFLVDLAIIISQVGFCCAYLIFISESLNSFTNGYPQWEWLCFLLPGLVLLCQLRYLSTLAFSSLFAQVSNISAFVVVFWFDLEHLHVVKEIHPRNFSLSGFPFLFAVSIYCYEGAGMILSLEESVHEDMRHKFKRYFVASLTVVTTLYLVFAICGYLSFGENTKSIIILNLPKSAGFDAAAIVKLFLCLALYFTYPVMMFPVVGLVEKLVLGVSPGFVIECLLRASLVILTALIVLLIPNFSDLVALIGATCCTTLAFILPGIFHWKISILRHGTISTSAMLFDFFFIFLGIVGHLCMHTGRTTGSRSVTRTVKLTAPHKHFYFWFLHELGDNY